MASESDWNKLASTLRELHRTLMERARRDYERQHALVLTSGELLQRLTTDPAFEWLRGLSELMADIDLARDADPQVAAELAAAVRAAVEHFVTPPASAPGDAFAQRYWPYVQDDPHVAMAHADVKRALDAWPRPQKRDAAGRASERQRLADTVRAKPGRRKS